MDRAPRRPALVPAVALAVGILAARALELPQGARLACWLLPVAGIVAAAVLRRPESTAIALVLGACAAGALLGIDDARRESARLAGWLPADGSPFEGDVEGRVLAAAAREPGGDRLLLAALEQPGRGAVVQIRVRPSPPEPTADLDRLRAGDRFRAWARVRRPLGVHNGLPSDGAAALEARGIDALGSVKTARLVERLGKGGGPRRWLDDLRCRAGARLDRLLPDGGPGRAIVGAMLLGERGRADAEAMRAMREAGTLHVLSISGLHVALVVLALTAMLRRVRAGPTGVLLVLGAALLAGTVLVGSHVPVVRASACAVVLLAGRALGRDGDGLNTLAVVTAALLVASPRQVGDVSFQLTVLATAGLLAFTAPVARNLPVPRVLATSLGASTAAYVATAPCLAWHVALLAPGSLATNLVAAPLCAVILAAGAGVLALADVPVLGAACAAVASGAVDALLLASRAVAAIPGCALPVAPPSGLAVAVVLGLLGALVAVRTAVSRRILAAAAALALGHLHVGHPPRAPRTVEVIVADVGQGQAVAVHTPAGHCLLVDAGGTGGGRWDAGERVVRPLLARRGCRRLAALAVSHDHDDHAGGAEAILRAVPCDELWLGPGWHRSARLRRLAGLAADRGTALRQLGGGQRLVLPGLPIAVLHPPPRQVSASANESSLVLAVGAPPARVLVPGDLEAAAERLLCEAGAPLRAEALVVPHHGSRTSSTSCFLAAVSPGLAVISAGAGNPFGHPHASVLERLRQAGVPVLRTDRQGAVELRAWQRGWKSTPLRRTAGGRGRGRGRRSRAGRARWRPARGRAVGALPAGAGAGPAARAGSRTRRCTATACDAAGCRRSRRPGSRPRRPTRPRGAPVARSRRPRVLRRAARPGRG